MFQVSDQIHPGELHQTFWQQDSGIPRKQLANLLGEPVPASGRGCSTARRFPTTPKKPTPIWTAATAPHSRSHLIFKRKIRSLADISSKNSWKFPRNLSRACPGRTGESVLPRTGASRSRSRNTRCGVYQSLPRSFQRGTECGTDKIQRTGWQTTPL